LDTVHTWMDRMNLLKRYWISCKMLYHCSVVDCQLYSGGFRGGPIAGAPLSISPRLDDGLTPSLAVM